MTEPRSSFWKMFTHISNHAYIKCDYLYLYKRYHHFHKGKW